MRSDISKKILACVLALAMCAGTTAITASAAADEKQFADISTTVEGELSAIAPSEMKVNQTFKFPTLILKLTGAKLDVSSKDGAVLSLKNGVITAVGEGDADITLTTPQGTVFTQTIHVDIPKTSIDLSKTKLKMKVGDTKKLNAVVSKYSGKLKWKSSNNKVLSVTQDGKIKAKRKGTATVTVTNSAGKSASCKITVDNVRATGIKFDVEKMQLGVGQTKTLNTTITPVKTTDKSVNWTSSNEKVATVDKNGKITAKKSGTATITATTENGKKTACKITVKKAPKEIILDADSITLKRGKTQLLEATVNAGADSKSLKYKSSDNKVATVSSTGLITAVKTGTATITVTSYNGVKATCKVKVKK